VVDPAGSNATGGLALRVTGTHKPLHHDKVEIPSGGNMNYYKKTAGSHYIPKNLLFFGTTGLCKTSEATQVVQNLTEY
jgi:hypothetical protein